MTAEAKALSCRYECDLGLYSVCSFGFSTRQCRTRFPARLPSNVAINANAGRGGLLIVNVRLGDEELPFIVDTGTTVCLLDKTLEPKLGEPVGSTVTHSWGKNTTNHVYKTPKLYMGGAPLVMNKGIVAYDLRPFARQLGRPIKGLLGMDCLWHYCVQLDFAAGKMRFFDDGKVETNKWGKAFPIVFVNPHDPRPGVKENLSACTARIH